MVRATSTLYLIVLSATPMHLMPASGLKVLETMPSAPAAPSFKQVAKVLVSSVFAANPPPEFHPIIQLEFEAIFALGTVFNGDIELSVFGDKILGKLDSSGYVPRLPPARVGVSVNYSSDKLTAFITVVDVQSQSRAGGNEEKTEAYNRLDLGMSYRFGADTDTGTGLEWILFFNMKNITDGEIRNSSSFLRELVPEPGRSIEGGIRLLF